VNTSIFFLCSVPKMFNDVAGRYSGNVLVFFWEILSLILDIVRGRPTSYFCILFSHTGQSNSGIVASNRPISQPSPA